MRLQLRQEEEHKSNKNEPASLWKTAFMEDSASLLIRADIHDWALTSHFTHFPATTLTRLLNYMR